MRLHSVNLVVSLLAISTCSWATADIYRWVDERGETVYSQIPPPTGEAVRLKKQPPPSAEATDEAQRRLRLQREQAFDEAEARKEAEAEKAKLVAEKERRASNCAAARENLDRFRNLGPRMIQTSDGRFQRLSEDDVGTQIEKARGQIDEYCD